MQKNAPHLEFAFQANSSLGYLIFWLLPKNAPCECGQQFEKRIIKGKKTSDRMQRHISIGGYTFICTLWLIFFLKRIHTWVNVTEELKVGKALTALFLSVSHCLNRVNG